MKKLIYILFIFLLQISCDKTGTIEFTGFPVTLTLKGEKITKEYFLNASEIHIISDSLGIFYSSTNDKNFINLINLENFDIISQCGIVGKGPGELINPGYLFFNKIDNAIWISDGMKQKIYKYPLDSIIERSNFKPKVSINYKEYGVITHFEIKDNKLSLYTGETGDYIFYQISDKTKKGIGNSLIYVPDKKYENIILSWELFKRHPSKDLMAIAYARVDKLLIINPTGEIIKKIKGPDFIEIPDRYDVNSSIASYTTIRVDTNYIYALYSGNEGSKKDDEGNLRREDPSQIFVFNWEGEPIKRVVLEYKTFSFDLDPKHNRIITYSAYLDEEIVCYDYEF